MKNKEFALNLEKRTKQFAVQMIRLSTTLPNTLEAKVIKNQLTKKNDPSRNSELNPLQSFEPLEISGT